MARLPRYRLPGVPQHVIQRGNNRQAIFAQEADYAAYAHWLHAAARQHGLAIHAYVLMTNHVHLLVTPEHQDSIAKTLQSLGRRYVQYFNYTYGRTGTLWEGRYRATVVDAEPYLLTCSRYIELNPVRAGLVKSPAHYRHASYRHNAQGRPDPLITEHEVYRRLDRSRPRRCAAYRALFGARWPRRFSMTSAPPPTPPGRWATIDFETRSRGSVNGALPPCRAGDRCNRAPNVAARELKGVRALYKHRTHS